MPIDVTSQLPPCVTSPELLALLERARQLPPPTSEQIRAQRRSYVAAEMGMGSDADELAYRAALEAKDEGAIRKLDAEGADRMARAAIIFDEMDF